MDVATLRTCIQSTLDANANIRRQAELSLKSAEEQPGFINALLDILTTEQENGTRLSTAVYLKNRITRGWPPQEENVLHKSIPDDERAPFRDRLLPVVAASPPQVRSQLVPTLQTILNHDFPTKWPTFMDVTLQLLNTNEAASVLAGLQCLLAICRTYRFKAGESRADLDKVVSVSFPPLLSLGNKLVDEESAEAGEMLRLVVKCFKHAIYFELPAPLRGQQETVNWCTLFLRVVGKKAPPCAMVEDPDEREKSHWWKSKKWCYANLNRLLVRYGNPLSLSKSQDKEYGDYPKMFLSTFAPEILNGYLREIEKWVRGDYWLSKPALSFTIVFLEESVKPKSMWENLKPHMEGLIGHLIFPLLCPSDEDIELFTDDPSEYLHRKLNFFEDVSAPDMAATNFLIALTKSRKKQTFTILSFVNTIVTKYESAPSDQKLPREKEGALRMIGSLASVILGKKSPIADQVEYFFVRHVFPEFRSPHGFLRARACNTLEQFEELKFQDEENLMFIYRNVLESMADPELPVRVMASLALQPLVRHDVVKNAVRPNIPQIMHQLLKLANEVDIDALANVMEEFVDVFSEQLTPFAVALSEQLRETYLRIIRELLERHESKALANGDDATDYGDYLDDKSIAALGVLQTIGTLILTLEASPDVLGHLETILMPVITVTLESKLYDLYNEIFEIIDSCTFASKSISDTMWHAFELMHKTFKDGAELYLEDMLPALENYVAYGQDRLVAHPPYLAAMVGMVRDIFSDPKVGGVDRICGCRLAEAIMLNLRGHVDNYVPTFIEFAMSILAGSTSKVLVKSYRIHLIEMVINAIYYNPVLAMHILETKGWTNKFFSVWFGNIEYFKRVHDKKLSIAAISSLLTLRADQVPASVQTGWPRLLTGVTTLFRTLPAAMKHREEAIKSNNEYETGAEYGDDEEDEEEDWTGLEDADWDSSATVIAGDDGGDVKDESQAYLDFLKSESEKLRAFDDDDDDKDSVMDEDSLLETPLDKMDPYSAFRDSLLRLQQEQPPLYDSLTKMLDPADQQCLQGVIQEAEVRSIAAQQPPEQLTSPLQASSAGSVASPTGKWHRG